MHEDFQLAIRGCANGAHLVERKLARQRHAARAQALRQPDAIGAGDAHLRAGVNFEPGRDLANQLQNTDILHDDRVGSSLGDGRQHARSFVEFMLEDESVESDEAFHTAAMEGPENLR